MTSTWTILGAGAIGGLFACQLSRAGIPVQLLTSRSDQISPGPTGSRGTVSLTLKDHDRENRFRFSQPDFRRPLDRLILTTKTYQSRAAINALSDKISADAVIIVMQNGMGTCEWLQSAFPEATILAATTTHGAYRENKHTIIHAGKGDTWLGPFDTKNRDQARRLCDRWQQQGVPVLWDDAIKRRLWLKLGINCAINPLTVIYNCRNGELLEKPQALEWMEAITKEFTAVYKAVFGMAPEQEMFATAKRVARKTAANISSMRQDVLNGSPTEIAAINGYLLEQAKQSGIDCPANQRAVIALDQKA